MLGMPELLVVLAIVVVLFGATKLPQLGKGLGEALGNFKKAQRDSERETARHEEIDATPRAGDRIGKDAPPQSGRFGAGAARTCREVRPSCRRRLDQNGFRP
jgi:sec-independent protein translocase protein TatA